MAASQGESKAVTPFMPSLLHFASVSIAVQLFENFGVDTLEVALTEIQQEGLTASEENSTKSQNAKESLINVPSHLRPKVMEAVHGSHYAVAEWAWHHDKFKEETGNLHWKSDGSIDAVKTAQNLVRNSKLDIKDRFELACVYCLDQSVETLWAEIETSGDTESFSMRHEDIVSFWVRWLRKQPRVSWTQSLGSWLPGRYYDIIEDFSALVPRCSACLPLFRPEERVECFRIFYFVPLDDLRFSLYTFTKDEEYELISTIGAFEMLHLHLIWPLQTLFVGTAERLWDHVNERTFEFLLHYIFTFSDEWKDFDYLDLFESFWDKSPQHLRESVGKLPELREDRFVF